MRNRVGLRAMSWVAVRFPERRESQSKRASICTAEKTGRGWGELGEVLVWSSTPERSRVPEKERWACLTVTFPPRTLERRFSAWRPMRVGLVTYQTEKIRRMRRARKLREMKGGKGPTARVEGAREGRPQEGGFISLSFLA